MIFPNQEKLKMCEPNSRFCSQNIPLALWTYCSWTSAWIMSKHVFEICANIVLQYCPMFMRMEKNHFLFIGAKTVEYKIGWMNNKKKKILYELAILLVCAICVYSLLSFERLQANSMVLFIPNLKLLYAFINLLNFRTSNKAMINQYCGIPI